MGVSSIADKKQKVAPEQATQKKVYFTLTFFDRKLAFLQ